MANLYETNVEIEKVLAMLEPDEDGVLPDSTDELLEKLDALQMEKHDILEYLAKVALDARASAKATRDEIERLKVRKYRFERKEERLMAILDRECHGQKTDLGVATLCYRKGSRVNVTNQDDAIKWLTENNHSECYRVPAPELSKMDVKKLIASGAEIPGVEIQESISCSLR